MLGFSSYAEYKMVKDGKNTECVMSFLNSLKSPTHRRSENITSS